MEKIILDSYDDVSYAAADIFAGQLAKKPDSIFGLATGSTPLGLYTELTRRCRAGDIDFSCARSFNLDEYYPIAGNHPQSYRYFMNENLFNKVNFAKSQLPDGEAGDPHAECARYDAEIAASGGIDLMLLGIGHNGHIGFNEPASSYRMGTYLVDLSESSLNANARFFSAGEAQPTQALTMGVGAIFKSKKILLLICGAGKTAIAKRLFEGVIHTDVPASFLLLHPDVTVLLDREAGGL